jgi:hypothetical protein
MPVILATQEAEIRRIMVHTQPRQIVHKTLSQKSDSRYRPWVQASVPPTPPPHTQKRQENQGESSYMQKQHILQGGAEQRSLGSRVEVPRGGWLCYCFTSLRNEWDLGLAFVPFAFSQCLVHSGYSVWLLEEWVLVFHHFRGLWTPPMPRRELSHLWLHQENLECWGLLQSCSRTVCMVSFKRYTPAAMWKYWADIHASSDYKSSCLW